jgi:hypothetical protein
MSDCLKTWGTAREAWTIIANEQKVTIEEAESIFCDRRNAGKIKFRCFQARRDPWTSEIEPRKKIKVIFPRITPGFSDGFQLKQWLVCADTIVDLFLKRLWQPQMVSCYGLDDVLYWTPAGCVDKQWVQWVEFDLTDARISGAPPSPPETEPMAIFNDPDIEAIYRAIIRIQPVAGKHTEDYVHSHVRAEFPDMKSFNKKFKSAWNRADRKRSIGRPKKPSV